MKKSRIRISFKSKTQIPLVMVVREWYDGDEVTFAQVLLQLG